MSTVKEPERVKDDKERVGGIQVSSKLRQKIADVILGEEAKKKKKVNEEQLKY